MYLKSGLLLLAAVALSCFAAERDTVALDGAWEFRLDPQGTGLAQKWYQPGASFDRTIQVPGAWQAQGIGEQSGVLRNHYAGSAWYRKKLSVPQGWNGSRVRLKIGGAHRRVTVFVNGVELGGHDGFSAPFDFDITSAIRPGAENTVVLRVENPPVQIEDSPDKQKPVLPSGMLNYIGNWGGIFGSAVLESVPKTQIGPVLVVSDVAQRQVSFGVNVQGESATQALSVRVTVPGVAAVTEPVSDSRATVKVALPEAPLWTPDNPKLITAEVQLLANGKPIDSVRQRFGFRQITTSGQKLLLNGKPLYLRGYGDDNVEVLTGFPATSRAVIAERLKQARSYGFNAVRFHSMTPPAEYFEVADEVGMLVMAELPAAYTQYFFAHRDFLKRELSSVLLAYRNHPSMLSLGFGNEFNLQWLKTDSDRKEFLESIAEFYKTAKELAPATLIMSNDGFDMRPTDMVSLYRGAAPDRPTVRHEFGQYYCSLPDFTLIPKFTGVIVPEWLHSKKKWVEENGLAGSYPVYLRNSQKLQQLGRKYQIERVRADANTSGYHYWLIVDYPGGTGEGDSWEEGWFDYFWQPKGVSPEEGRELNAPVLMMIDAGVDERTMWAAEPKRVAVRISNYGSEPLGNSSIRWTLFDGEKRVRDGGITTAAVGLGEVKPVGTIDLNPGPVESARRLRLVLTLQTASGPVQNRWDFWAYPRPQAWRPAVPVVSNIRLAALRRSYPWLQTDASAVTQDALLVTDQLDGKATEHLRSGGSVWLLLRQGSQRRGVDFFPASGGAFGTSIKAHPALKGLATDEFCDLQFYNLVDGAYPLPVGSAQGTIIDGLRTTSEFLSKTKNLARIAFAVEGKVGQGRLLITTLRLRENFDDAYPEAVSMFDAFLRYASGTDFQPSTTVPAYLVNRVTAE